MAVYDAGAARARYELDTKGFEASIARIKRLYQDLDSIQRRSGAGGGGQRVPVAQTQQQAERAILARARAEAQLAQVQNTGKNALEGLTQAERIYADALSRVDRNSLAAIRAQTQLAAIQNRIANQAGGGLPVLPRTLESFGTEAIDQFKAGILGLVGPAALVTAGFTAAGKAVQAFQDGFRLKAELDQTTASLQIQLRGVRDSATVFAEASQFANQYKLTQQETNQALSASVGILRNSRSSTQELLGVLARLQVLSPEQGLQGAALAVKELNGGDIQSLVERFEVSRSTANKMKEEIKAGGDAVQVLSKYLDSAGVSMDALRARTEGAAGAQANLAQAQERFSLALGNLAASGGAVAGINALAQATNIYAQLLNGEGIQGVTRFAVEQEIARGKADAYAQAIKSGKTEAEAAAIANNAAEMATRAMSQAFGLAIPASEGFRSSLRGLAADASNAAAALEGVQRASGFKGSIGARASDPGKGQSLKAAQAATAAEQAYRAQILATGSAAQIVAIRQQEYNAAVARFGKNSAEAIKAQTALIQARRAGQGAGGGLNAQERSELALIEDKQARLAEINRLLESGNLSRTKRNQLELEARKLAEDIATAEERRHDAALGAAAAAIEDRKARRQEERQLARLDAIAAAGGTRGQAAADEAALIRIRQEQRARALNRQAAEAGGVVPTFGTTPTQVPTGSPQSAAAVGAAAGAAAAQARGPVNVVFTFDKQVFGRGTVATIDDLLTREIRVIASAGA